MALIGRHAGDVAWGALQLPEVLGSVNDATSTHGFVVATTPAGHVFRTREAVNETLGLRCPPAGC